jgi:hypothetical protein
MALISNLFHFLSILDEQERNEIIESISKIIGFSLFEFAIQIILLPMIHELQLLVEDQELEKQLRNGSDLIIKLYSSKDGDIHKVLKNMITSLPVLDLT